MKTIKYHKRFPGVLRLIFYLIGITIFYYLSCRFASAQEPLMYKVDNHKAISNMLRSNEIFAVIDENPAESHNFLRKMTLSVEESIEMFPEFYFQKAIQKEFEEDIILEPWMYSRRSPAINTDWFLVEEELKLEEWMINPEEWSQKK